MCYAVEYIVNSGIGDAMRTLLKILWLFGVPCGLLIVPFGLTFILIAGNYQVALDSFSRVDINYVLFRWVTAYHILWIIFAILAVAFYIVIIFVKGYWVYILGIFAQVGMFVVAWLFWLLLNGSVFVAESVTVEETTYHIVAHNVTGSGHLYLFRCVGESCFPKEVGYIDSGAYHRDIDMVYDSQNNTLNITTDLGYQVEDITIPLK